jgi:hypothetical protein
MCEALIRAKTHWKDAWNQATVNALSTEEKQQYDARTQLGDIIVIRPDGWEWGSAECLPDFVLVKIPDMTVEEAKQYEESINEEYTVDGQVRTRMLRFRKWFLKPTWVNTIISQGGVYTISKATVVNYIEAKVL